MGISFICEKAGPGTLNASRATAAIIREIEYFDLIPSPPFIVVPVVFPLRSSEDPALDFPNTFLTWPIFS